MSNPPLMICSIEMIAHRNYEMRWCTILHEPHVLAHNDRYTLHQIRKDLLQKNKVICGTQTLGQELRVHQMISKNLCQDVNSTQLAVNANSLRCTFDETVLGRFWDDHKSVCSQYLLQQRRLYLQIKQWWEIVNHSVLHQACSIRILSEMDIWYRLQQLGLLHLESLNIFCTQNLPHHFVSNTQFKSAVNLQLLNLQFIIYWLTNKR